MKKRGQFYLIGAIIIIIIMFATFSLTNRSSKQEYSIVYDLSDELDLEKMNIQQYGIANSEEDLGGIIEDFLTNYSVYAGTQDIEIQFFFAKLDEEGKEMKFYEVKNIPLGEFNLGNALVKGQGKIVKKEVKRLRLGEGEKGDSVTVKLSGKGNKEDEIEVKYGEYFYIIAQEVEGNQHIVTSQSQDEE